MCNLSTFLPSAYHRMTSPSAVTLSTFGSVLLASCAPLCFGLRLLLDSIKTIISKSFGPQLVIYDLKNVFLNTLNTQHLTGCNCLHFVNTEPCT